jgi:Uma2 family endonuclease
MSAIIERQTTEEPVGARRLWTIADLAALPDQLPTGPARYELWDGELRLMSPPGEIHGNLQGQLVTLLNVYGAWEGLGRADAEVGIVLKEGDPATVVGADAAFYTPDQLPVRRTTEGYSLTVPALVVEVRSKNDTLREMEAKARAYLAAGVTTVWVADPLRKVVTIYRGGQEPEVLGSEQVLTAPEFIPRLEHPIAALFEGADE